MENNQSIPNQPVKVCPKCGNVNIGENQFCLRCSLDLSNVPYQNQAYQQQPNQSQQPIYSQAPTPPQKPGDKSKNGVAIAGLVVGIVGLVTSRLGITFIIAFAGILLSAFGLKSQKRGQAIGGLVTSILGIIVALSSLVAMMGGTNPDSTSSVSRESRPTQSTTQSQKDTSSNASSEETQKAEIGARKNPANIGDTVSYEINSFVYGKGDLEITLDSVVRGEEAAKIIADANLFNSDPEEGKEYIIATFTMKNVKDRSSDDTPIKVTSAQFKFANSTYAKDSQVNFTAGIDTISAELYEGSETTGAVVLIADQNDSCYAVYQDDVWFSLG